MGYVWIQRLLTELYLKWKLLRQCKICMKGEWKRTRNGFQMKDEYVISCKILIRTVWIWWMIWNLRCFFTFLPLSVIFSALFALRHKTLCDPCRRRNSIESKPLPSEETKMAELMRLRVIRSDMEAECSSWKTWKC